MREEKKEGKKERTKKKKKERRREEKKNVGKNINVVSKFIVVYKVRSKFFIREREGG